MPRRKGHHMVVQKRARRKYSGAISSLSRKKAGDLSTAQLLRLIDARQKEISCLCQRKQNLEEELAAINARLSELQGDSKAMAIAAAGIEPRGRRKGRVAKAATARQGGRRPGVNRAAILKFLARKGRATIAEMQKAVAKAGGNPKYIQKAIQRMKAYGEIENVPNQRGVYQLKK